MNKAWWRQRAWDWRDKALVWKEKYLTMRDSRNKWEETYLAGEGELRECEKELAECEEEPDPQPDKKLTVENGKILYGGKSIKLIGCSRYKALFFSNKQWEDWGVANLEEYESELIKSGINYVRHGICKDMGLWRQHCIKMGDNGIIVEGGLYNHGLEERMGGYQQAVKATIDLPNVFYDAHNEFCAVDNISKVREIMKYVNDKGGICSAGAWGHSPHGQEYSEIFNPVYSDNQIISVHREWTTSWITKYLGHDKPVIRNEYFDLHGAIGFEGMKRIMKKTIEAEAQGCQYFMFDYTWKERLAFAGNYCKKLNA